MEKERCRDLISNQIKIGENFYGII